ncbi:MAG: hypothetical protein K2K45_10200 [Muribaculaceae bacterium]|nr:hypothetical protein [Muribaculaceae bacterium]
MKRFLFAAMLGGALLCNAETVTSSFSYIDGVEDYFGMGSKYKIEVYDVAIRLPGDVFEGYKIKEIKMPVRSISGIENYGESKVWLSSDLFATSNINDPDLGIYDAAISMVGDEAVLAGTLPESYTIGADGVYVGVSIGVLASDDSTDYPISLGASDYSESFWLHIPSYQKYYSWTNGFRMFGYGCGISVILEKEDMPAVAVKVADAPANVYMELDASKTVDLTLSAVGSQSVSSVDFEYSLGGKSYSYHYDLEEPVAGGVIGKQFSVSLEIPAQSRLSSETVEFKVVKVNGEDNPYIDYSANTFVNILKMIPVHQVLFEEFTSTGCQYCTRGYAALAYIKENYPDFVTASYHTNYNNVDPMKVVANFPVAVNGYPAASIGRNGTCDPYFGNQIYDSKIPVVDEIIAANSVFTPWNISVSHTWDSDDHLTAKVDACNVLGYENGLYRIAYILVADGLSGEGSGWIQNNGFGTTMQNDSYVAELNDFCRGGKYGASRIAGLVFDDVVISAQGYNGVQGSVPVKLAAYEEMSHTFTFDLSKVKSEILPDKNKLRIIAALVDSNGKVLNSAKNEVNDYTGAGVESVAESNAQVEYFNLNGVKVSEPSQGIYIRRQGGKTEKVVIR